MSFKRAFLIATWSVPLVGHWFFFSTKPCLTQGIPRSASFSLEPQEGGQSVKVLQVDAWGRCNPEPSAHLKPLTTSVMLVTSPEDFASHSPLVFGWRNLIPLSLLKWRDGTNL